MSEHFDFSAVQVKTVATPTSGAGRPKSDKPNPFTEVLAASYEDFKAGRDSGRALTIPAKAVREATYFIRRAADDLKIGARVVLRYPSGDTVTAEDLTEHPTRKVVVTFAGKDRKAAPKPKPAAEGSTESA